MFEFIDEDLKLNKHRQLSPRQKAWLKGTARIFSRRGLTISVVFAFLGLFIALALYLQNEDSRATLFSNSGNLIIFSVVLLGTMGIPAVVIFLNYRNANRLENSTLLSTEGKVRLQEDSSAEAGTIYYVFVGEKRFTFWENMRRVFKEGEKYKFYYCKAGVYEFVMSYEKLND